MSENEIKEYEAELSKKEKRYSNLMRRAYEVALVNRKKSNELNKKAQQLLEEIIQVRRKLEFA
jgi:small-conductance mechanosensitive channel